MASSGAQDGVKPLNIIVVGGGIGGQSAAIFLRRAGHKVSIYESSRFASETGAAIHIPSNVNGLLRRMGMIPEEYGANQTEWVSEYKPSGERVFLRDIRGLTKVYPYPWQLIHRVDLHNGLKEIATRKEGKGTPAVLNLRSRVISVDTDTTSVKTEDGNTYSADLIVAADGIHSKLRTQLVPHLPAPEPSGTSAFRFLIPIEKVRANPKTAHFVERKGEMLLLYGTDRRIVVYPCRNNTLLNFVAMHPDEETEAASDDWDQTASKEKMLSCYTSYPADVQELLSMVEPEGINLWKLLDHDALGPENWVKKNVVLLGDAAHGFLPHQGQGGAQAIEDAAALGALFPEGTSVDDISKRLELYVKARYDRATAVQDFTRQAAFKTPRGNHGGKVMDPMQFTQFNMNHDAFDYAQGMLFRHGFKDAKYKRMPVSFGPSPGPRQDLNGKPRGMGKPTYKTSFIEFKTTKSSLTTLLPSDDFEIANEGAWGKATFSVTKLGNLDWLGGRGYSFFGLYIHDVVDKSAAKAETAAAAELKGDFLPILFENMADPITTGREELGFAKAFATLDEKAGLFSFSSSYTLNAGWEGTEFAKLTLENLTESKEAEAALQTSILHYKTIPNSVGKKEQDAEYSTTYPALPSAEGEKRWTSDKASIEFTQLEGEELVKAFPTLANIIKGLRNIKVLEVLRAGQQASP